MKQFLKKIIKYVLAFSLIVVGSVICNKIFINAAGLLKLKNEVNTIVLGASRTVYSVNDHMLTQTTNISANADALFYSYIKLRTLHSNNPNLKRIIVCLGSRNLSDEIDTRWLTSPSHLESRLPQYIHFYTNKEYYKTWEYNKASLIHGIMRSPLYTLKMIKKLVQSRNLDIRILNIGGFKVDNRNILTKEIKSLNENTEAKMYNISVLEANNLKDIYDYCKNKNLELIFLDTPIHSALQNSTHTMDAETYFNNFINENYSDIPYYDYSRMKLDDSCFNDLVHLSYKGALLFTEKLIDEGVVQ
ncbi:hypothetical protein [Plebeiibacterium sediminum]|uniref:Uncharacterized protein n=1 Tax=Plebeiibacterium sediminum TaxID=2992112 RepID=A0AAE3M2Y4_9BACT|nr:hypothetical protein [Plebeiobacterium sediminum]MCW3786232.1 hypothetical protein [Plebeiobacterium sediminum]